jgi:oxygen-independent coproporphyrinogen-3 oxidase
MLPILNPSPAPTIPLSLYVHFPWCVRKCPYCDFNSHEARGPLPERAYLNALLADLEQDLPTVSERPVLSIFIGGGTPSLLSAETLARLLTELRTRLTLAADAEITLEANPGTIEQEKFRDFRAAGINRLSIGIQSFNPTHLERLGRIHNRQEAFRAAETAHAVGLDNFNLDLMFGLPGQTVAQALADLDNAIALEPAHLSHYQLTLEPNTRFHRYPPDDLPDEDTLWDMQHRCQTQLAEHGYEQYEVSAYARPDRYCRHNLNYWQFGDYLGLGAGAHGKLTDTAGRVRRRWKLKHPRDYLRTAGRPPSLGGDTLIPADELPLEFMLNALRLVAGVPTPLFSERTGLPLAHLVPRLQQAQDRGLLHWDAQRIGPTAQGLRFLNNLLELFLPEARHA